MTSWKRIANLEEQDDVGLQILGQDFEIANLGERISEVVWVRN